MAAMNRRQRFRPYGRRVFSPALFLWVGAVFVLGAFLLISFELRPLVETFAVSRAENLISVCMSVAVDGCLADEAMDYTSFISLNTDAGGSVLSLTGRPVESNRFKKLVIERLVDEIGNIASEELEIPIGNLSGNVLLSGVGPSVRVKVYSVGDITAFYSNSFTDAGVNQTHHCIYLNLTATVHLLIPGDIISVTVEDRICVAETIILGDVPDTYIQMDRGE